MKIINEMSQNRSWIIDKCAELGGQFTEHFDKIYNEVNNDTKIHHAHEMQVWFNRVKNFRFTHNKKYINTKQLWDWFFLNESVSCAADLFPNDISDDNDEAAMYVDFADLLLDEDYTVQNALIKLGLIEK